MHRRLFLAGAASLCAAPGCSRRPKERSQARLRDAPSASAAAIPSPESTAPEHEERPAVFPPAAYFAPPLLDPSGRPLPQTEAVPSVTSEGFRARAELLARAISRDDPELATPAFFPVVAYRLVKAIENPERDWKLRLLAAFARDIHDYRRRLGRDAKEVNFLGIDVPEAASRWMKPGKEGNKIGYYRVLRSHLRFGLQGGREQSLEVTSMISWRGEWYVVHLNGFG